jgi:TetR/AcrR family transcriptional repressor of nem operon
MVGTEKRDRLVRAADILFHRNGFEHTSIADIAAAADVPVGNVYYYFKSRGDFVKAVTELRAEPVRARRAEWDELASPKDRLLAYVKSFENGIDFFTAHGCPTGGLCVEANKQGGPIAEDASALFRESLEWLGKQFRSMGQSAAEARSNAARVLSGRQGSVLLANTFQDPEYIRMEIKSLKQWLGELPSGKERKKT